MNRTLTFEIKDIPDEVWAFLVAHKGSEEQADELIIDMMRSQVSVSLTAYYQLIMAQKAGISLDTLIPSILDLIVEGSGEFREETSDELKLNLEKHLVKIVDDIEKNVSDTPSKHDKEEINYDIL